MARCRSHEIETGTSSYDQRGTRTNLTGYQLAIPRAGGLHELVDDATRPSRSFDFVVCENINRLARNPAVTFTVEEQLRVAGVSVRCADEPVEESFGSIVLRHLNVGLARGFHFDLMKKSREGRESGTRQGWHMGGIPPYVTGSKSTPTPTPTSASRAFAAAAWSWIRSARRWYG